MRIRRESFGWEKDQQFLEVAKKSRERVVVACGSGCGCGGDRDILESKARGLVPTQGVFQGVEVCEISVFST